MHSDTVDCAPNIKQNGRYITDRVNICRLLENIISGYSTKQSLTSSIVTPRYMHGNFSYCGAYNYNKCT